MAFTPKDYSDAMDYYEWMEDRFIVGEEDEAESPLYTACNRALSAIDHATSISADIRLGVSDDPDGWNQFDELHQAAIDAVAEAVSQITIAGETDLKQVPQILLV